MILKKNKGLILVTTLVLLAIISYTGINLFSTTLNVQKIDEYRNDGIKAFNVAEAGINQVIHYFNHPEKYPPDSGNSLSKCRFYYDEENNTYPNSLNGQIYIDPSTLVFNSTTNELGRVTNLRIEPYDSSTDPIFCFGKIISVGKATRLGVEKTVIAYFKPSKPSVRSLAAIISKETVSFNGDVAVHWGEVWTHAPTEVASFINPKLDLYVETNDPGWTVAKTTDYYYNLTGLEISYMDGTNNGSETEQVGLYNPYEGNSEYDGRFMQYQNLEFPQYDYEEYKEIAQKRGEYYTTDADGNIYKDGIEDAAHKVMWDQEFGNSTVGSEQRFVFIDTIDGNPPTADGSNLTMLTVSGSSPQHFRGFIYIGANLDIAGLGNPPTIDAYDPAGVHYDLTKMWIDGLIYIAGTLKAVGNPQIYGAIIVEREVLGGGTPEVWYNSRLADGISFPVGNFIKIDLMKIQ